MRDATKTNLQMVKRFVAEAKISSQLNHPHTTETSDNQQATAYKAVA